MTVRPTPTMSTWMKDINRRLRRLESQRRRPAFGGDATPVVAYGSTVMRGSADTTREKVITYPTGRFQVTPTVLLQTTTGYTGGSTNQAEWPTAQTATSFQLNVNRSNATDVWMTWVAMATPGGVSLLTEPQPRTDSLGRFVSTVTCPTEGCANADQDIEVNPYAVGEDGISHRVAVECGVCGADIGHTLHTGEDEA